MIKILIYLTILNLSFSASPTWSAYPTNVMYSGQYKAFTSVQTPGVIPPNTQSIYRVDVTANKFTTPPVIALSLQGFQQAAPLNGNTIVGFDVNIQAVRINQFDVVNTIYGASMGYLHYMYMAIANTNTDYNIGYYSKTFDTTQAIKTYDVDISYNVGQQYPNYLTNKIEMKGFLAGYRMRQGTASGIVLSFTMTSKSASQFTIQVSTDNNSFLQQIWFYRIGYDRTAIEQQAKNDVFPTFYYELSNNFNTKSIYNAGFTSLIEFQYRNYLAGVNKINVIGTIPMPLQIYLYYYFAAGYYQLDNVTAPLYIDNPAQAQYLYGQVFYHSIESCPASDKYFLVTDKQCYASCSSFTGFVDDLASGMCLPCHLTCKTCSQGYSLTKCLTCDANSRVFESSTSKCICPQKKYDDGVNLVCPSCHSTCLSCNAASSSSCKSCDSALFREFSDPNSDGIGTCVCSLRRYEDSNQICKACSVGCLSCTVAGSIQTCSNCDSSAHFLLVSNKCQCAAGYALLLQQCKFEKCGDGVKTSSQECDDNNLVNGDGCSNQCKVESNHACFEDSSVSPYSICYFNGKITMAITDVTKSPYANEVSLSIKIDANSINQQFLTDYLTNSPSITLQDVARRMLYNQYDQQGKAKEIDPENLYNKSHTQRILASSNVKITSIKYDSANKILYVTFQYFQTFDITKKTIIFQPSSSVTQSQDRYFYSSPTAVVTLQPTFNKIPTVFYNASDYNKAVSFKYVFLVLIILFWIAALFFIVIGKGNIAMESMLVLQIAYASLLSQQKLQITFGGLSEFGKYTAGFNVDFLTNFQRCVNFVAIKLSCSLVDNLNLSFYIMVLAVLIFFGLKLTDKILNKRAEEQFGRKKQRKYINQHHQRTDQNINNIQNGENQPQQQAHPPVSEVSESSQAIQLNYYKDQEFVPKKVFNILLDFVYFMAFITVIIWALSLCFIKQEAVPSILQGCLLGLFYLGLWIYWFLKYSSSDFSFVEAHKGLQQKYDPSQASEVNSKKQQNAPKKEKDTAPKSRFSSIFIKVVFYPIIWLGLMGISLILALTQSIGFVTEGLIIGGSLGFGLIIWFTKIYKQRLNIFRSIFNCIIVCLIQIVYIISQLDSISGTGIAIVIVTILLLFLAFLFNVISTLLIYKIQLKLENKEQEANVVSNIQKQINRLEQIKMEKQHEQAGLFLRIDPNNSLKASRKYQSNQSEQYERTIKKTLQYNNPMHSNQGMFRQQAFDREVDFVVNQRDQANKNQNWQIYDDKKVPKSQQKVPQLGRKNYYTTISKNSLKKASFYVPYGSNKNTLQNPRSTQNIPSSRAQFMEEKKAQFRSENKVELTQKKPQKINFQKKQQDFKTPSNYYTNQISNKKSQPSTQSKLAIDQHHIKLHLDEYLP